MRASPLVALCFAVACQAAPAAADDAVPGIDKIQDQVQGIYEVCQAPRQSADWNLCVGYIEGAADQLAAVNLTCPGGVAYFAMVQAFMNWAAAHPEKWTMPRGDGVFHALSETWPCPSK
jgi:hypothetical protein